MNKYLLCRLPHNYLAKGRTETIGIAGEGLILLAVLGEGSDKSDETAEGTIAGSAGSAAVGTPKPGNKDEDEEDVPLIFSAANFRSARLRGPRL